MPKSFEQHFAQKEENTNLSQKERKNLKLKEKIEEMEDIVTRMEKEGKTAEGYQRIIELIQKIEELYEEKESPELSWDWETKEKLLTDWENDYVKRFTIRGNPHFSPDGEKIMVIVKKEGKYYRLVKEV